MKEAEVMAASLRIEVDTLVGTLDYGPVRVATGTMGYKHKSADLDAVRASLATPNFLLKIIPHVDGSARICELVEYYLEDVTLKGAWTGPGAISLTPHALAPVAKREEAGLGVPSAEARSCCGQEVAERAHAAEDPRGDRRHIAETVRAMQPHS